MPAEPHDWLRFARAATVEQRRLFFDLECGADACADPFEKAKTAPTALRELLAAFAPWTAGANFVVRA